MKALRFLPLFVVVCCAKVAEAHVQPGGAAGFVTGFSHPISGLDHVVAMIAIGLWGAQLGTPAIWFLPVAFPIVMAVGGMLALIGVPLPGTEIGIAVSAILLGSAVIVEARPPLPVAVSIAAFFAVFHGHAHGAELPPGADGLVYSLGFVIATGGLHAIGIAIGLVNRWMWGRTALRLAGGMIGAAGLFFLWRARF